MSFLSHANKTYIHINGFALGLGLKRRLRATRKWAIEDTLDLTQIEWCLETLDLRMKRNERTPEKNCLRTIYIRLLTGLDQES